MHAASCVLRSPRVRAAAVLLASVLAPPSWAPAEVLRIGAIPDRPCDTRGIPGAIVDQIDLTGDRSVSLDDIDLPEGWTQKDRQLVQADACDPPLRIETQSDWVRVAVESQQTAALVEFGPARAWIAPKSRERPELGARTAIHTWRNPKWIDYRRSLSDEPAFTERADGRRRLRFPPAYDLDPYPALRSANLTAPAAIEFPQAFVPKNGTIRVGLIAEETVTVDVRAEAAAPLGGQAASKTVSVSPNTPTWLELPLRTSNAGFGALRLTLETDADRETPIEVIAPEIVGQESVGPPRARRPNLLLVTLDTVRADHLSLYGYERATTPFLDEIADELRIFENAYSQIPSTRPSHFSILTSRYPRDLGTPINAGPPLPQSELSVAEVLQSAGWSTGAILSVRFLAADGGASQGFADLRLPPPAKQARLGRHTTEEALDFIRENEDRPFFLWVHYFDAHLPYQPVPELRDLFWEGPPPEDVDIDPELLEKTGFGTLHAIPNRAYMTAMYDASIRYLDDQLRTLFHFLAGRELLDDTVVVIAADHGEALGEHGVYYAHDGLHEHNVRVPLIVRLPRGERAGRVDAVVENLGIAPTLLDAAALEIPESFRAGSLLAENPGNGTAVFEQGELFSGMRRGPLKWIDARGFQEKSHFAHSYLRELHKGPPESLFDVESDPTETENLAAGRPGDAAELERALDTWKAEHHDPARRAAEGRVDRQTRERLRALGYTE